MKKTCFLQNNYKILAKAIYQAGSSSNLASTSCTHRCFVEFLFWPSRGFLWDWRWVLHRGRRVVWVSRVAAWGIMEQAGAIMLSSPLRPYLDLVLRTLNLLPLDVMLVQWPLCVRLAIFSLFKSWTIYALSRWVLLCASWSASWSFDYAFLVG